MGLKLDFLIVGAARSGTSSLYYYLKQHPQIYLPTQKEPWFLSFAGNPPNFKSPDKLERVIWKFEDYVKLFSSASEDVKKGEASTSYLYTYKTTISNIKKYLEDWEKLKIIIILRNPIERAWSQFMYYKMRGVEPLPFEKAVDPKVIQKRLQSNWNIYYDYLGFGLYYSQVKEYLNCFKNTRIYLMEDLKTNPNKLLKDIFDFLEVNSSFVLSDYSKYNVSGYPSRLYEFIRDNIVKSKGWNIIKKLVPYNFRKEIKARLLRKEKMPRDIKSKLINFYKDDVIKLGKLINRNLDHWLICD